MLWNMAYLVEFPPFTTYWREGFMIDKTEVVKLGVKSDVIKLYAQGYTPKDIFEKHKLMSRKTAYKWYKKYRDMKKALTSSPFTNALILALADLLLD